MVLPEPVLTRLCRIAGGGAYFWHSPLGHWFEDVRALGFLRPPWALASARLFAIGWEDGSVGFACGRPERPTVGDCPAVLFGRNGPIIRRPL